VLCSSSREMSRFLQGRGDHVRVEGAFETRYSQEAAEHLRQLGKSVEYYEIPGDGGHVDAIYNISAAGDLLRGFISH
jgi:acetyl esterase/lipase